MNAIEPIRVLFIEDHPVFRMGLRLTLNNEGSRCTLVAEVGTVMEAQGFLAAHAKDIDLILCDHSLPDGESFDVLEIARRLCPQVKFVVLSGQVHGGVIHKLTAFGIDAFINKDVKIEDLESILVSVMEGTSYVGASSIGLWPSVRHQLELLDSLSDRELEILDLSAKGMSAAQVADALCLSRRTVENHKEHIFDKIGAKTSSEMQAFAYSVGLGR